MAQSQPNPEEIIGLDLAGQSIEATRYNTALYTFAGELACYDHIFVVREVKESGVISGNYIWQSDDVFDEVRKRLRYLEFPQFLNSVEVSDSDVTAFNNRHYGDIKASDVFPEAWVDQPGEVDDGRGTE